MDHVHFWRPGSIPRTLVLLHGTGGDEHDLIPLAEALDPHANVLSIRGNVKEGAANRFFRRLAEGVFDEEDLQRRSYDLADFLVRSAAEHGFSLSETVALGFSNGANIAAAVMLLRPEVFGGGILIRSMVPLDPTEPPNLIGKRVLMLAGDHDPLVPVANVQRLADMFISAGADVQFELLPGGHELTRKDLALAKSWLS